MSVIKTTYLIKKLDMSLNIKKTVIQTKGRLEFDYGNKEKNNYLGGSSEIRLVSGTTYHQGQNIQISADNVISAVDTKYQAGSGLTMSGNVISVKDDLYVAGNNINITNNVISTSANVHSDSANQIVICTQNAYDNMPSHDASTIYLITASYLNVVPGAMDFDPNFPVPMNFTITSNDSWTITIEYNE